MFFILRLLYRSKQPLIASSITSQLETLLIYLHIEATTIAIPCSTSTSNPKSQTCRDSLSSSHFSPSFQLSWLRLLRFVSIIHCPSLISVVDLALVFMADLANFWPVQTRRRWRRHHGSRNDSPHCTKWRRMHR